MKAKTYYAAAIACIIVATFTSVNACEQNLGGFGNQVYHYYKPCHKVFEANNIKTVSILKNGVIYFAKKGGSFVRAINKNGVYNLEYAIDKDTNYTAAGLDLNRDQYLQIADMVISCSMGMRQEYIPLQELTNEQLARLSIECYGKRDIERNKAQTNAAAKAAYRF